MMLILYKYHAKRADNNTKNNKSITKLVLLRDFPKYMLNAYSQVEYTEKKWMRSIRAVEVSDSQCRSRNCPMPEFKTRF